MVRLTNRHGKIPIFPSIAANPNAYTNRMAEYHKRHLKIAQLLSQIEQEISIISESECKSGNK